MALYVSPGPLGNWPIDRAIVTLPDVQYTSSRTSLAVFFSSTDFFSFSLVLGNIGLYDCLDFAFLWGITRSTSCSFPLKRYCTRMYGQELPPISKKTKNEHFSEHGNS